MNILDTNEGKSYNEYRIMKPNELLNKYFYTACYIIVPDLSIPTEMDKEKKLQITIMQRYFNNKLLYMMGDTDEQNIAAKDNEMLREKYGIDDAAIEEVIESIDV